MIAADLVPALSATLAVLDDPVEQSRFTRWRPRGDGGQEAESAFQLTGIYCAACSGTIEAALMATPGVLGASVSAASRRASVRWDPARTRPSALVRAVQQAGYDAVPDAAAPARALRQRERRQALWRLFVAGFCAMQVMMFATPSYVATGNDLAPDLRQLLNWGCWLLALPVLLFAAGPFFQGAWRSLKRRRIGMDVPVALGVAVTFIASTGATFDPAGPFGHEVYFDSMTMFVGFLLAGRYLEMSARHRSAEALEAAVSTLPETAQRIRPDGTDETVSVQRLQPGDTVRVAVGSAFPADGTLLTGRTQADEALLTGESRAVEKAAGAELVGGSVNLGAPVLMRVDRVGADTRHDAIVAMMRDALSQRPALMWRADAWAGPFLWLVLALAGGAALVWQAIDPSRAIWVAVSVLIVTCPCALSLAAPSALIAAAGALARRGVMLQRLDALEALATMTHLFTDKTGTLTEDRPQWVATTTPDGRPVDPKMRRAAVALARWSAHPLSQALVHGAAQLELTGASAEPTWQAVTEVPGSGLQANDEAGRCWRLGSAAWMRGDDRSKGKEVSLLIPPDSERLCVHFGELGRPTALRFSFDEGLRPDALQAVQALQADGVRISLLSGDAPHRVQALAERLHLADAHGAATPAEKLRRVAEAQAAGEVVGMLGDGVNDAPVLAQADVSVAMGQGALVSRAHSDAVIVSNRLGDLVLARRLAQRTLRVVRQNMAWAAFYNAACIPLALAGWLPPWAAGLGMALSSLLVVANAARLSRGLH